MNRIVSEITLTGFSTVLFGIAVAMAMREIDLLLKFSECLTKGIGIV